MAEVNAHDTRHMMDSDVLRETDVCTQAHQALCHIKVLTQLCFYLDILRQQYLLTMLMIIAKLVRALGAELLIIDAFCEGKPIAQVPEHRAHVVAQEHPRSLHSPPVRE